MRLHEHEAAGIFAEAGIPVPDNGVASTPGQAGKTADRLGYPVMLKAQVLVGGRGLAGGIRSATNPEESRAIARTMLKSEIRGIPVRKVMVSRMEDIEREFYIGVTVDGYRGAPVMVVSSRGGVSIEEVARTSPECIASQPIDIREGFFPYQARRLLRCAGIPARYHAGCADVMRRLYAVFSGMNALIAEINPLVVTRDGALSAVDAVLEVDDSAMFRVGSRVGTDPMRIDNELERRGREIGVTYVDLDGDVGIISSGAGLGMATMDIIGGRLRPANFLETGGGITAELLYDSMALLMSKPGLRAVFINIYGGINPIHEGAKGVVKYIREHGVGIPVVAKALGNRQEETWDILRSGGVHVVTDVPTERAAARLFELLGE